MADLAQPLKPLQVDFSEDDMKELAYEIIVAASGPAVSARTTGGGVRTPSIASPRYQERASAGSSRVKVALSLKSRSTKNLYNSVVHAGRRKSTTPADIMRVQLEVSEESDLRTRKALSRAAASQAGKRVENLLVPLELLQNVSASDFSSPAQYKLWHKRQVKVLEAGLVLHFAFQDVPNSVTTRVKNALQSVSENFKETGRNSGETMQVLRSAALAKAGRTITGDPGSHECHWADGSPFNWHIYDTMLVSCFDTLDSTIVIDEVDDVMEILKKTWCILDVNQLVHDVLFMWVLFRQFVTTGHDKFELLEAAAKQMMVVAKSFDRTKVEDHRAQNLGSTLNAVQAWSEKRLLDYRESFPSGATGPMEHMLSVAISSAQILHNDIFAEHCRRRRKDEADIAMSRIDVYIRSTVRTAFAQIMESVDAKRKHKGEQAIRPSLAILAEDITQLANSEKDLYCPILKIWHPYPASVVAATLHACYGREFKQFLSGTTFPTADAVQVLSAADQLEKDLIPIAVEDALFSEDGGKAIIREMPPYEADTKIKSMATKWIEDRVEQLVEMVDRSIIQEKWDPRAIREKYAPSAVEMLALVEVTLDTYFAMPLAPFQDLLQKLVTGVDGALASYAKQAVAACGTKEEMIPALPPLTRCKKEHFKLSVKFGARKNKGRIESAIRAPHAIRLDGQLEKMCVRINTLHHLLSEVEFIEKKIQYGWQEAPSNLRKTKASAPASKMLVDVRFEMSRSSLQDGIQKLCELAGYRTVFVDLHKVIWEGLYVGGVENSRMNLVIDTLDPVLGTIAETVTKSLRNRAVVALMQACLEAFLLVLLAGGPSRTFTVNDSVLLEEDLTSLKDLFKADGDGLSEDIVENSALQLVRILSLFSVDTDELIAIFKAENTNSQSKSPPPLPRTIGKWSPSDANTLLRVLCYRADDRAAKFLKKTYNLPTKL